MQPRGRERVAAIVRTAMKSRAGLTTVRARREDDYYPYRRDTNDVWNNAGLLCIRALKGYDGDSRKAANIRCLVRAAFIALKT